LSVTAHSRRHVVGLSRHEVSAGTGLSTLTASGESLPSAILFQALANLLALLRAHLPEPFAHLLSLLRAHLPESLALSEALTLPESSWLAAIADIVLFESISHASVLSEGWLSK